MKRKLQTDGDAAINATDGAATVEAQMRQLSRRSFVWSAAVAGTGLTVWKWLISRRQDEGIPWPLRRALQINEEVARDYFQDARLAPTFAKAQADAEPRVNGDIGLGEDFDPAKWKLRVEGLADANAPMKWLTLAQIKALPVEQVEMTTELKCIEGWSIIVRWTGVRLSDFMRHYAPATQSGNPLDLDHNPADLPGYVGLETPDGAYYVGLDMAAALHPQTLLCYAMNGEPLTPEHGAPLRLAIPVKYGIKNIKRIGVLRFSTHRPADYWAEQGYDWYAGH